MDEKFIKNPTIGLHKDIPFEVYARIEAVNNSTLTKFRRSAAHAHEAIVNPKDATPAQQIGSAVHTAVLEPEHFEARYVRAPVGDKRTKAVKAAWADLEAQHPDATVLAPSDFDTCSAMRKAAWANPLAREILSGQGINEATAIAELFGVKVKCRPDRLTTVGKYSCIVDVKTTRDASAWSFAKDIATYSYHTQAAFYTDALNAIAETPRRFLFLAIEKEPPHCCAVYELDGIGMEQGRNDYERYLRMYVEAKRTNTWPGYPTEVQAIEMPRWAVNQSDWVSEDAA